MVDLALVNGKVWTGDAAKPWAEAVAARGDRIYAVGTTAEVGALAGPGTKFVDLGGAVVLPGFNDSHTHFLAGGFALKSIQLRDAKSRAEFTARVAAKARELGPDRWILTGDWDHQQFDPVELPRRDWIDAVTPDNPVCVNRFDGHMVVANTRALQLAGVTKDTPAPPGGEIGKDPVTGEPTGILKDTAIDLVLAKVPEPSFAEKLEAAEASVRHAAANGVTSVSEMADAASFEVFQELLRRGRLTTRVNLYIPITEVETLAALRLKSPFGGPVLKLAGLKGFVDGSLGSGTAFFFEPYTDEPGNTGLLNGHMFPEGIMEKRILAADRAGLQVAIHAIGDRANSLLLDIFEKAVRENGPRDRRWRVEHAQHMRPADIARFGKLGLVAAVQPYHAIDDGRWAETKIGPERIKTTYAFESLRRAGAVLAFGSDWTVGPLEPILGIYAAVTRRTLDGADPGGWVPGEKVSVEEAVRAYTVNGAWAEFAEADKGTIEPGKLADLVVLDRDIFTVPPEEIGNARVRLTVFDGRVVYGKDR
ncbi:MAG: amidohydrolase [Candidatus Aminicenantes bacterium]|nr:amidohydrolase [Candidatus Aminicenantes bacterium]NLH77127.1 amidohydrolase [Acidobacteriota bacterium]